MTIKGCTFLIEAGGGDDLVLETAYSNRARAFIDAKRYRNAVPDLLNLISIAPKTGVHQMQLGAAYLMLGKHDRALIHMRHAVTFADPKLIATTEFSVAVLECGIGRAADAMKTLRSALKRPDPYDEMKTFFTSMQRLLLKSHGFKGPADGEMSPETTAALERYFKTGCIEIVRDWYPDGIPGTPSWRGEAGK